MVRRRAALAALIGSCLYCATQRAGSATQRAGGEGNAPAARRRTRLASTETAAPTDTSSCVIAITPEAQDHTRLRAAEGPGTHLRMGVKAGAAAV